MISTLEVGLLVIKLGRVLILFFVFILCLGGLLPFNGFFFLLFNIILLLLSSLIFIIFIFFFLLLYF